jgi:peroxiredoxin
LLILRNIKRYVIVADDGKISTIAVEENPPEVTVTGADTIIAQL